MSLGVTVLGCSGSYPGPGQACSGYLVRTAATTVWLDAGSGTLANLQLHAGLGDVDAIVLSHEHPDHWSDVEGFAVASRYALDLPPVDVYAAPGIGARLQMPLEAFGWNEVGDGDRGSVGDMSLTFSRTDHGPVTLAVRLEGGGRALGYSADTGPDWSLAALGPGLHLALCEATYLRTEEGGAQHMSARQAGADARQAGLERLVLTHRMPTVDPRASFEEGSEAFGAPVGLAAQGLVIDV